MFYVCYACSVGSTVNQTKNNELEQATQNDQQHNENKAHKRTKATTKLEQRIHNIT